jgi:hypothetical protein
MDNQEMGDGGVDRIDLAQDREKWHDSFFYCCTVHSEIYVVHSPTNALFIKLGKV